MKYWGTGDEIDAKVVGLADCWEAGKLGIGMLRGK